MSSSNKFITFKEYFNPFYVRSETDKLTTFRTWYLHKVHEDTTGTPVAGSIKMKLNQEIIIPPALPNLYKLTVGANNGALSLFGIYLDHGDSYILKDKIIIPQSLSRWTYINKGEYEDFVWDSQTLQISIPAFYHDDNGGITDINNFSWSDLLAIGYQHYVFVNEQKTQMFEPIFLDDSYTTFISTMDNTLVPVLNISTTQNLQFTTIGTSINTVVY